MELYTANASGGPNFKQTHAISPRVGSPSLPAVKGMLNRFMEPQLNVPGVPEFQRTHTHTPSLSGGSPSLMRFGFVGIPLIQLLSHYPHTLT